jgi:cell division protein FtsB
MPLKKRSFFIQVISSRLFIVTGLAVLIFLGVSIGKELTRKVEVTQRVSSLKNEIASLEKRNTELSDLINYLNSESYREREARLKLGLKKEGEQVIIIPNSSLENQQEATDSSGQSTETKDSQSAAKKWWNYFFK